MRRFKEGDLLSADIQAKESHRILFHESREGTKALRPPPRYIDNPFNESFLTGYLKPHPVQPSDDFCIEIPDAVLFGERAVVTRDNILVTDYRCSPPQRLNFPPEARAFEMMEPSREVDGYFVCRKVDRPRVRLEETACLISSREHDNYGAVLLREIPKLLILKRLGLLDHPVISPDTSWHRELLEIFGARTIVAHDRRSSYRVKKLILPSQKTHMFFFGSDVVEMFNTVAEEIRGKFPLPETPLLYVSRIAQGKLRPHYRRCVNEEELADSLVRLGFKIIEPEAYSVKEQISMFRSARFVVGPSGAGMFNTLFCQPGTHVLSLEPLSTWIWQHCNLFGSMGHAYGLVTGGAFLNDPEPVQKSWKADIPVVLRRVEAVMKKIQNM